jgi:hypothetical protein
MWQGLVVVAGMCVLALAYVELFVPVFIAVVLVAQLVE